MSCRMQVHPTRIEAVQGRAETAEQRVKDLSKDKRTIASAVEKQAATWEKKVLRRPCQC